MRGGAGDSLGELARRALGYQTLRDGALRVGSRSATGDLAQGARQRAPGRQPQAERRGEQPGPGRNEEPTFAALKFEEVAQPGVGGRAHGEADATMFADLRELRMTLAPLSLTAHLRPKPDVLARELEGEAVLLDLASGRYFGLNATGVRIWALLAESSDLSEIRDRLAAEYALAPEAIAADLLELCAALESAGLVDRIG